MSKKRFGGDFLSYPLATVVHMAKTSLVCSGCGYRALQWVGRCPGCGQWDSLGEVVVGRPAAQPVTLASVASSEQERLQCGIAELDRVLGGGAAEGSVILLAGEPGVGKSTLALQASAGLLNAGKRVLIVCGEESLHQVAARAKRLGGNHEALLSSATDVPTLCEQLMGFDVVIVDSVQMLSDPQVSGEAGSPTQVRNAAASMARAARSSGTVVVLIGHVTKDGAVAGPRVLEHLVDVVLMFEGDRGHALRTVRGIKNRYGPAGEVGIFEMGSQGLRPVTDPSRMFIADGIKVPGSFIGCVVEGRRPLALEVQALTVASSAQVPRRVAQGVELTRLGVILAVLQSAGIARFNDLEVYVSVLGGFRAIDPGFDLALALALVSQARGVAAPAGCAAVGEISLTSGVRPVPAMDSRIEELSRLGSDRVIVPASYEGANRTEVHRVRTVADAVKALWG